MLQLLSRLYISKFEHDRRTCSFIYCCLKPIVWLYCLCNLGCQRGCYTFSCTLLTKACLLLQRCLLFKASLIWGVSFSIKKQSHSILMLTLAWFCAGIQCSIWQPWQIWKHWWVIQSAWQSLLSCKWLCSQTSTSQQIIKKDCLLALVKLSPMSAILVLDAQDQDCSWASSIPPAKPATDSRKFKDDGYDRQANALI